MKKTIVAGLFTVSVFVSFSLQAAPVGLGEAKIAVENWLKDDEAPLKTPLGRQVHKITTVSQNGQAVFHCAQTEGGGTVIVSTDTTIMPIVAFAGESREEPRPGSPLFDLLTRDLAARAEMARRQARASSTASASGAQTAEARWAELLNPPAFKTQGRAALGDVRVAPLVESAWNQESVSSKNVYNYYTPYNYPCGCVATATAQIMRYHSWPAAALPQVARNAFVEGYITPMTTQGGAYAWADMPLNPRSTITQTQQKAIGRLTSDLGILLHADYYRDGTAAYSSLAPGVLTGQMGYASAKYVTEDAADAAAAFSNAILSNLDAGFPVGLSISDSRDNSGHAVVGDGYGYNSNLLYVHLNMGWSGQDDVWYNLPVVDSDWFYYDTLNGAAYNIFPTQTGELITGRVTIGNAPAAGITVTASNTVTRATVSAATGSNGIYALFVSAPASGKHTYNVSAYNRGAQDSALVEIAKSVSADIRYVEESDSAWIYASGTVGSRWGIDLDLSSAFAQNVDLAYEARVFPAGGGASAVGVTADGIWSASADSAWIRLTSTAGAEIAYTVSSNTTGIARSGLITAAGDTGVAARYTVWQNAQPWSPTLSADLFTRARAEGRRILLMAGSPNDPAAIALRAQVFEDARLSDLLADHYLLAFADSDTETDWRAYAAGPATPFLCVINPHAAQPAWLDRRTGPQTAADLATWLTGKLAALTAIEITGSRELNAGRYADYTCFVTDADGSRYSVTPQWSITAGSDYATISAAGRLTARAAREDQTVTLRAGVAALHTTFTLTVHPSGGIEFAAATAEVNEGETLTLTVFGGDADTEASVKYWIIPGTAGTADYALPKPHPGSLAWAAGDPGERTLTIPVKADKTVEDDEFFFVQLGAAQGMEPGLVNRCAVTIRDANRPALTLQAALDSPVLNWTSTAWVPSEALHAAVAEPAVKRSATLQAAFTGQGTFTAKIKIEDDAGDSVLQLWDGKNILATWNGATDWIPASHALADAAHTLKFTFTRGAGNARAILDETAFTPAGATHILTAAPGTPGAGSVTGSGIYRHGTQATLTAKASPGWELGGWSHPFANPLAARQTLAVTGDLAITPRFTRIPFIGALPSPAEGGSVSGSGLCAFGKKVTLKATPAKGYAFMQWSDGNQQPSYPFTQPAGDILLTALFKLIADIPTPAVTAVPPQNAMVGLPFELALEVDSETLPTVTVTGLPTGLKFDKTTLAITGRPGKAGTFNVTVRATNITKRIHEIRTTITVAPLPEWAIGSFSGVIIEGRSGRADITISATGAVTGSCEDTSGKYTLKTLLEGTPQAITLAAGLSRGRNREPIALALSLHSDATLSGTLSDPETEATASLTLWQDRVKRDPAAFLPFKGQYNIAFREREDSPAGYLTLTLPAKSSKAKIAGRLTNSQPLSASALCVPLDDGSLLVPLWIFVKKTGSILTGHLRIAPEGTVGAPTVLAWRPDAASAFAPLAADGGLYTIPADENLAELLPNGVTLSLGGAPAAAFTFSRDSAIARKPLPGDLTAATLALTRKTGLFTGKLTYPNRITRTYWGLILPNTLIGAGYAETPGDAPLAVTLTYD